MEVLDGREDCSSANLFSDGVCAGGVGVGLDDGPCAGGGGGSEDEKTLASSYAVNANFGISLMLDCCFCSLLLPIDSKLYSGLLHHDEGIEIWQLSKSTSLT